MNIICSLLLYKVTVDDCPLIAGFKGINVIQKLYIENSNIFVKEKIG
jgi:hypothetical protein